MARRWWRIFGGLAALSLLFCGFASYAILPGAYAHRVRFGWVGGQVGVIQSIEYLQPPEGRVEAWCAVVGTALLPAAWVSLRCASVWRNVRSRARAARGHCPFCGYDCRATPGRCPECGRGAGLSRGR